MDLVLQLHLLIPQLAQLLWQVLDQEPVGEDVDEHCGEGQGGITCGAIDEPRKSSKAIDERVIINFRDKNVVIARFRNKNVYQ